MWHYHNSSSKQAGLSKTGLLCFVWFFTVAVQPLYAQEYSIDGNRWYEVEVIVFQHQFQASETGEQPLPALSRLEWFDNLQELRSATASYLIDFPGPDANTEAANQQPEIINAALPQAQQDAEFGPRYQQDLVSNFRLDNFNRDPYIALDKRYWKLTRELQRLQQSTDYQVLWHGMWRQPMQGIAQTPAVYVHGGEEVGGHHELEGSFRLTDNNGNNRLDINVWMSRYLTVANNDEKEQLFWQLPALPWQETQTMSFESVFRLRTNPDEVWQITERRNLENDLYYYLDNPVFGVLIQIRSYLLPVSTLGQSGEDF